LNGHDLLSFSVALLADVNRSWSENRSEKLKVDTGRCLASFSILVESKGELTRVISETISLNLRLKWQLFRTATN